MCRAPIPWYAKTSPLPWYFDVHPYLHCHNRLILENSGFNDTVSERLSGRSGTPEILRPVIRALLIKAWNLLPSRSFPYFTIDKMTSVKFGMYAALRFALLRAYTTYYQPELVVSHPFLREPFPIAGCSPQWDQQCISHFFMQGSAPHINGSLERSIWDCAHNIHSMLIKNHISQWGRACIIWGNWCALWDHEGILVIPISSHDRLDWSHTTFGQR